MLVALLVVFATGVIPADDSQMTRPETGHFHLTVTVAPFTSTSAIFGSILS